ncbi:MAG TPA: hypothetical protein PJ991_05005 [Kiritimatiellia bacterium]|nr:hypothetical protein [Kiritimatiellia bacterium]
MTPRWRSVLSARWEWMLAGIKGQRPTPLILLSNPRCGNNMLRTALSEHPDISLETEIFQFAYESRNHHLVPESLREVICQKPELGAVRCIQMGEGRKYGGFTLFYYQMRAPELESFWHFLGGFSGIKIINLARRLPFKQWLSFEEALASKVWYVGQHENYQQPPAISLDPSRFNEWIIGEDNAREFAMNVMGHHERIDIYYEDLVDDYENTMKSILTFLDVPCLPLAPKSKKMADRPVRERVANLSDFEKATAGTRAGAILQDALADDAVRYRNDK